MRKPISRFFRLMCLALVMCMGLIALATNENQPPPKVIINGNQATRVENNTEYDLRLSLYYDSGKRETVDLPSGRSRDIESDCYKITYNGSISSGGDAWSRPVKKEVPASEPPATTAEEKAPVEIKDNGTTENTAKEQSKHEAASKAKEQLPAVIREIIVEDDNFSYKGWQDRASILKGFDDYLEGHSYYALSNIEEERFKVDSSIEELSVGVANPKQYASQLYESIDAMTNNLERFREGKEKLVGEYLNQFNNNKQDKQYLTDEITRRLNERLDMHEENLERLTSALDEWETKQPRHNWPLIGLITALAAIGLGLVYWFVKAIRKNKLNRRPKVSASVSVSNRVSHTGNGNDIVVRRKTTSILKKQSLENVNGNPNYLAIDCIDFCPVSAVRRIYLKNTCIKDIYNMYAEDLRNPENPKEDGCMVLGRWVHDKENNEYYVSLEEVVMPGDDAIFSEYELNFGGKIKLKVSERLRKLRRETDLQYDMTCWVHSHPGLGVFFSNQDNTVHMQLKHPTHPHFLTALVIDILTPEQKVGIFTFKPDGHLNSEADLTRMYSLEEMYKWAIESERNTFKRDDHFDTLANCKQHENNCHGVHLSNSAIIDIDKLVVENENGMAGMVHGFVQQEGTFSEIAVTTVCQNDNVPDNEPVGCFIITKYCSIPTVRKAIESHAGKIRFALVYSSVDGLLTTIPIQDTELMTDENYYGEQKLEDLKIWTRRKR